ncbi:hypothetical protein ACRAWG_38905 (plasmid) [Methylobacterium sp. P31]
MPRWPDHLSDPDRIKIARARTDKLIDHIIEIFAMHEANTIVVYSPRIASQIPPSRAAAAFRRMQTSQLLFELIRLCALWDSPREDRESIPTILELLNKPEIVDRVVAEKHARFANDVFPRDQNPQQDPEIEEAKKAWWLDYRARRADQEAQTTRRQLQEAVDRAAQVRSGSYLNAMRGFRDAHVAHNLDAPKRIEAAKGLRHGDERRLLRETVKIADRLHRALHNTSFTWLNSRRMARREARALWTGCTFDIDPRA